MVRAILLACICVLAVIAVVAVGALAFDLVRYF